MVQNVCMSSCFDIPSKTQICQKCHFRPYCIQPTNYNTVLLIVIFGKHIGSYMEYVHTMCILSAMDPTPVRRAISTFA